jgi:hypothetical protein
VQCTAEWKIYIYIYTHTHTHKCRVARVWEETFIAPCKLLLPHLPTEAAENYYTFSVNLSVQLAAGISSKAVGLANFSVLFCFRIPLIKVLKNTDISLYVRHSSICLYDTLRFTLRALASLRPRAEQRTGRSTSVAGSYQILHFPLYVT